MQFDNGSLRVSLILLVWVCFRVILFSLGRLFPWILWIDQVSVPDPTFHGTRPHRPQAHREPVSSAWQELWLWIWYATQFSRPSSANRYPRPWERSLGVIREVPSPSGAGNFHQGMARLTVKLSWRDLCEVCCSDCLSLSTQGSYGLLDGSSSLILGQVTGIYYELFIEYLKHTLYFWS